MSTSSSDTDRHYHQEPDENYNSTVGIGILEIWYIQLKFCFSNLADLSINWVSDLTLTSKELFFFFHYFMKLRYMLLSRFGGSTFLIISEEIEQNFPNEKSSTYYIPYVPVSAAILKEVEGKEYYKFIYI